MDLWRVGLFRLLVAGIFVTGGSLLNAGDAQALGLGLHVAVGQGENNHEQIGISLDTAVAEDRQFNYRMNLGFEKFELEDHWGDKDKFSGWILENTFGFQILANEKLKLWAGPQIVTGLYENDFGFGLGASLGVNLHIGDKTSLGITLGVRRSEYSGILDDSEYDTIGYLRVDFFFRTAGDRFVSR